VRHASRKARGIADKITIIERIVFIIGFLSLGCLKGL